MATDAENDEPRVQRAREKLKDEMAAVRLRNRILFAEMDFKRDSHILEKTPEEAEKWLAVRLQKRDSERAFKLLCDLWLSLVDEPWEGSA